MRIPSGLRRRGDRQRAAAGHRVERVGDQVEQRHLQLCGVRPDRRQILGDRDLQPNLGARQPRLGDLADALDDVGERDDLRTSDGCRAWSSIVRSTRVTCWICASTVRSRRAGPIVGPRVVADHLDVAGDQVQRRARLMGDVGGDLTQRRDALGAPERFAQREQLALAGRQLRVAERQIAVASSMRSCSDRLNRSS